jgi:vacuolar iron transporter family protein
MATAKEIEKYRAFLEDELNSVALYHALAKNEKDSRLAEVYHRLADTEQGHADIWAEKLKAAGEVITPHQPGWRTRTLIWLARRLGAAAVLPTAVSAESMKSNDYSTQIKQESAITEKMIADEQSHARLLRQIGGNMHGGLEGPQIAKLEGRHRSAGGNALRAAVLGANDGLVSNFSLVMGVAGAQLASKDILLTGLAGLLAGAISMALGEWISVQSSRELYERQIRVEREEIEISPEEEIEELGLIYQSRGLEEAPARNLANQIMSNRKGALQALSRDELGIDPEELGGSAWEASISSFLLFSLGAIIPVLPYMFLRGWEAVLVSAVLSATGLFLIGAAITLFTGRSIISSGLRQMVFGLVAALVTYLIGRLIGVTVGG